MIAPFDSAQLLLGDATDASLFADDFFQLTVTSPPYNVGLEYGSAVDDAGSYEAYLEFSRQWLANCYRWTAPRGRLCLNIPLDKNSGGKQAVTADLTNIAREVGWRYHATIIWNEGNISRRTAWGSWLRPSAPHVIAPVETIVVLYKQEWNRPHLGDDEVTIERSEFMEWTSGVWTHDEASEEPPARGEPLIAPSTLLDWAMSFEGAAPISVDELQDSFAELLTRPRGPGLEGLTSEQAREWASQVWTFGGESAKRIGHPAPFPIELPRRCIRLFSYQSDRVLDPFAGSGTTLIAALREGREAWGIELDRGVSKSSPLPDSRRQEPAVIDQTEFTKTFFKSWPNHEFDSYDAEEALRHTFRAITGERFRDPGRKMRDLVAEEFLIRREEGNQVKFQYRQPEQPT